MQILSVTSEMFPLVKTGGLADVAGALPLAMAAHGVDMRTMLPGYSVVLERIADAREVVKIKSLLGAEARILDATVDDMRIYVLDCPAFFKRVGGPYVDVSGHEWPDNWQRYAALSRAAAMIGEGADKSWTPDIVHAHDWQAAMTLAYMRHGKAPKTPLVITIHNLAFQGRYGHDIFQFLDLPPTAWDVEGVEYYGGVGFLKAGLVHADAITTVSPTYAREIRRPENGMGLDGLLDGRSHLLSGVLNGIDTEVWNPETDKHITANYSLRTLKDRLANKRALEARLGMEEDDSPIISIITRLTWQKGMDILADAVDDIVGMGVRIALLGSGDNMLEGAFLSAADRHRGKVGVQIGYDEAFSHLLMAGGDAILVPSRFEPCGLTQLYGLRYGCVPIVSRVGGLADTVIHANHAAVQAGVATGVVFGPPDGYQLRKGVEEMVELYRQPRAWRGIQKAGMKVDNDWSRNVLPYVELYRHLIEVDS